MALILFVVSYCIISQLLLFEIFIVPIIYNNVLAGMANMQHCINYAQKVAENKI